VTAVNAARSRLHTAYFLLVTALLGLPLVTPLLRLTAVPCTHDGHLHYHRAAAMAHAWENGVFLTRWLPDLAFGYGYPFFVFREPAPLYAILLPHLVGLPLPAASNLFYALTILAAGVFMALWVRDVLGPRAAVVSAVAYMAAPYVLIDTLVRGNSPESLALPLLPLLLWAGRRWTLSSSRAGFLIGVLGLALLSLGHNISTFIFAPTLLVYLVALALFDRRPPTADGSTTTGPGPQTTDDRETLDEFTSGGGRPSVVGGPSSVVRRPSSPLARAVLLFALGLGLAFFYTGGALLEMDEVTLEMSTTTRNNDWRFNFASMGEILSPVAAEDPALVNPPLHFRLGWAPLLLAVLGATGLLWIRGADPRSREQRLHIWLMLAGAAVYLFMALPLSRPLWEALPLIDFVQFPWRFVGRAALPVAFLAGVPFLYRPPTADGRQTTDDGPRTTGVGLPPATRHTLPATRHSPLAPLAAVGGRWSAVVPVALAIALLIAEALPALYPRYCPEEPFPTINTVHAYEHATGLVGVDPEGSYFPRTVEVRPTGSPLEADYAAGRAPQRFDATALPSDATVANLAYTPLGVTLAVTTPEPFTARYLSFAFPGWWARVDEKAVAIVPEDQTGLITFAVPAGTHSIAVGWGATPLRLALGALSGLAAIGVAAVLIVGQGRPDDRRQTIDRRRKSNDQRPATSLPRRELAALGLLALALLGVKTIFSQIESPLRRVGAPPVTTPGVITGGELRFEGYKLNRDAVPAGGAFDIDMAWTAVAPPSVDYQTDVWLAGPDGLIWSVKGTERPRVYEDAPPTRLWAAGEWAWDSREVRVLSGAPPGRYDLVLTLFDRATLAPVTLTDTTTGAAIGPTTIIGQIDVANPDTPPDFAPQYPLTATVAPGLRLLGYNQDRATAAPGESVLLTLFWECDDPTACRQLTMRLYEEDDLVKEWPLPVIRDGFPADAWPAHGRLRGQHLLRLPATLESGVYRFFLDDGVALGELQVVAPERHMLPPPLTLTLDASFATAEGQPVATLVGLASDSPLPSCSPAPTPGAMCAVPLVWRADAETPINYRVFVHLVDIAGHIVAQSDAEPHNWTRPTTGWLPGEYVTDVHTLALPESLPPGPLSLRVGLYDPDRNARLITGGADFVTIDR